MTLSRRWRSCFNTVCIIASIFSSAHSSALFSHIRQHVPRPTMCVLQPMQNLQFYREKSKFAVKLYFDEEIQNLWKEYFDEMKGLSGIPIEKNQRRYLDDKFRLMLEQGMSLEETITSNRSKYTTSKRKGMIRAWEKQTKQTWPVISKTFRKSKKLKIIIQQTYDLHHILPLNIGGENDWENIYPLSKIDHEVIHRKNGPLSEIVMFIRSRHKLKMQQQQGFELN